jgi:hypothetical protein
MELGLAGQESMLKFLYRFSFVIDIIVNPDGQTWRASQTTTQTRFNEVLQRKHRYLHLNIPIMEPICALPKRFVMRTHERRQLKVYSHGQ